MKVSKKSPVLLPPNNISLFLPHTLRSSEPSHTILDKLLNLRLQLGLMQRKVVNCSDAKNAHGWEAGTFAIHEGAACRAEVVGHFVARVDRLSLAPARQVLLAAQMREVGVIDGEVRGEHGGRNLVAVVAVADERVDKAWAVGWLWKWSAIRVRTDLGKA